MAVMFVALLLSAAAVGGSTPGQTSSAPATQPSETIQDKQLEERTFFPEDWPSGVKPFGLDSPTMTDDWFGLGSSLRDTGIDMKFFWNQHYMAVLGGGVDTNGGGKSDATMDWLITLDLDKMGLMPDAEILAHAREQWGGSRSRGASINPRTGSSQQVNDDADGARALHVDQLWYRQHFFERKLSLQLGQLDYQTIVDRNVYANSEDKQFMNAALDNNPLIPTASQAGLGVAMTARPCKWYSLILGIGDAQRVLYQPGFHSTFHDEAWFTGYMEHDFHVSIPTERGPLPGNYRFGMVYEPAPRSVFVRPRRRPVMRGSDYGWYMSHDQMLFRENEIDRQGLGAFFRYADRHDDVFRFSRFLSAGLVYTGLVPTRDKDTAGFAIAQLRSSKPYKSRLDDQAGSETIYELYYAIQLTPWLVLTPDIQYIDNPGGTDANDVSHAIAGGLRARVTF